MNINIKNTCYTNKDRIIDLDGAPRKVGNTLSRLMSSVGSKYGLNSKAPIKISVASLCLQDLLKERLKILKGTALYLEYKRDDIDIALINNDNFEVKVLDFTGNLQGELDNGNYQDIMLYPIIVNHFYAHTEIGEMMPSLVNRWNTEGILKLEDVYKVSDSFNFEYLKNISDNDEIIVNVITDKKEIESELLQIKQAIRGGHLTITGNSSANSFVHIEYEELNVVTTQTTTYVKEDAATIFDKARKGEYLIDFDWTDEQKEYIEDLSFLDRFIASEDFCDLLVKVHTRLCNILSRVDYKYPEGLPKLTRTITRALLDDDYVNAYLYGRPGSGKTTIATALSAAIGFPIYTVSIQDSTEEDKFEGMNKIVNGKIDFVLTEFSKAFSSGGIIVLEESNLAKSAILMGALGQAIIDPFVLKINGYEDAFRHPMTVIISTSNIGTNGSKPISEAFGSRYRLFYQVNDPEESLMLKILALKGNSEYECKQVYTLYSKVLKYLTSDDIGAESSTLALSMRQCRDALQNMREGDSLEKAVKSTILGVIGLFDNELYNDVEELINEYISI